MVMMGIEFTGKVPFSYIYLHGLIRDSQVSIGLLKSFFHCETRQSLLFFIVTLIIK